MSEEVNGRRVLVIEDNLDIRGTVELVLEAEGFDVMVANNGADALALLRSTKKLPSVILLDLMMPVMDGYAFRAAQQSDPTLSRIPVVVLTADGHAERKAASLGAAGFLQKPVDLDTLVAEVARHQPMTLDRAACGAAGGPATECGVFDGRALEKKPGHD